MDLKDHANQHPMLLKSPLKMQQKKAVEFGMKTISVKVQGPGAGRDSAIRGLISSGLYVTTIKDITPVPHNGVRPSKKRRV